jgi:DNA-directed RNA polymerase subunit RPC12/RpoP
MGGISMKCPYCGSHFVRPEGANFVVAWREGVPDAYEYHCHSCDRDFTYSPTRGYYVDGRWEA